jgi:small-conductance mechanosensitive channel
MLLRGFVSMDWQHFIEFLKWLGFNLGLIAGAMLAAFLAHALLVFILLRLAKRTKNAHDELIIRRCASPTRWIAMIAAVWLVLLMTSLPPGVTAFLQHLVSVALILLTAWLLIRILRAGREVLLARYNMAVADNLHARAVHTQMAVIERILIAVIIVIAFGCCLMTFDGVRQLGVSLLASAGIVGVILGLAAQKVIGTLFAGLQMAITQPIRIEDVVIVEGEWGIIEEITLTYVVVRIWDLRRLVVPTTYFMEKPFQNWTRISADILGTVFLYVDASAPVEPIREELQRLLKDSPLWDGKVCGLQVTNVTDRTMELRALMSAANASIAWDLRCHIRERLLDFVKSKFPGALPRVRIQQLAGAAPVGAPQTPDAPAPGGS